MKAIASVLALAVVALFVTSCKKEDPTAAIDKQIMAAHDSLMALDAHAAKLVEMLKAEAAKVDTAMPAKVPAAKKAEVEKAHAEAVAKVAVMMKDADAIAAAQKQMQDWMAAYGMLLDSRFGRVVFFSTVVSVAVWLFFSSLAPAALVAVGLSSFDLGVLLVGFVFLAGAAAALLDFVGWLRGEWTTPPPPFQ